ncbi:MAG: DNA alkylation repair protein [Candidatus Cohnella colombiensis]|uniref:DNA alkylation repair protein n=1 Tax=Candidatus Cohnella colombiensis TaxID=3121368 RepID=A0AA95JCS1_9BACL|nr:MAG: DNA alkylation repair protein [Cohnella sp.]
MQEYTKVLTEWYRSHANAQKAKAMEAYLRDQYPFLGIKTPERRQLLKQFKAEHGMPNKDLLLEIVQELWQLPEREFQNVAMDLLGTYSKHAKPEDIDIFEQLITMKSWWDTVDYLAASTVGDHLKRFPQLIVPYTERWIHSDNLWLRRSAILYQLKYKKQTDVERLFAYIQLGKDEQDFFIRKAIGWALREYAKTDADAVKRFVAETKLSPLSEREALKRL